MKVRELLQQGRERLAGTSDTAALDARLLACKALGIGEVALFREPEHEVAEAARQVFMTLLAARQRGEPLAYLLGEKEFYGATFKVTPAALIPRPETELLVEQVLACLPAEQPLKIADLGTGSGCIAVTLARLRPAWQLVALDRSADALVVARDNASIQQVRNVTCREADWLTGCTGSFAAIVANPPYVAEGDTHLQQGDVRFEPLTALASGKDGLDDIRRITQQAVSHLQPQGWLWFEHGFDQGAAVRDLLEAAGFTQVRTQRDLAGHERVTGGCRADG